MVNKSRLFALFLIQKLMNDNEIFKMIPMLIRDNEKKHYLAQIKDVFV